MSNSRTNSAVDGSMEAGVLAPANNCRPSSCRVMKLSSRELSMRCRLRVASARVNNGLRLRCRDVSQWGEIDQSGVAVSGLQSEGEVDGDRRGSAATFGVHHGEHLAPRTSLLNLALSCSEANKSLEKVRGGGGTLDELASAGAHGIYDDLRLVEIADGEHCCLGQLLVQKFNGAHGHSGIVGGNIDQDNIGAGGLHTARDGIGCRDRKTGAGMNRASYTGAIHQYLEHGALLIVGGHDDD